MPSLQIDQRRLAWEEIGQGQPLLCHPGGPGASSHCFGDLPELAAERTLLLLDPRGTGASAAPADPHAYELADYAADIEAIREYLGLARIDLLGHSHGGFVAMAWAAAHPERVGRLVLAHTAARFTPEVRRVRQEIMDSYSGEPWYEDALAAQKAHEAGPSADEAEFKALLTRRAPFYFPRWGDDEKQIAALLAEAFCNPAPLRHFNERIAPTMDLRPGLAGVDAPTLVITGALDPMGPEAAKELSDALPHATVVVMPEAGHFPFGESPNRAAWARTILDFLAGR